MVRYKNKGEKCRWEGCRENSYVKGFCNAHYQADRKGGYVELKECFIPGCDRVLGLRGARACKKHMQFMWRYSLSDERASGLFEAYGCGNGGCGSVEDLHLDHDHSCCDKGKYGTSHKVSCGECVRGWLCRSCNWALGLMQESPGRIQGLLDYLSEKA